MEHNKEDAFRAKEMAEKKFLERDIASAKKFALKAQNLYPTLDGISQFLATIDVYISAQKRRNGEIDWYGVLGIKPPADDDVIRKHYRKLAIILHPDKNKSVGADGAFRILCDAWGLLSDKSKRSAYDQKLHLCDFQKVPDQVSAMQKGQDGFRNFVDSKSTATTQKSAMNPKPAPPPKFLKPKTFWTVCNSCRTQFEYLRAYVNKNLICQNCRRRFQAFEVPSPPVNDKRPSTISASYSQGYKSTQHNVIGKSYAAGKRSISMTNIQHAAYSGAFAKGGTLGSSSVAPTPAVRAGSLKRKIHSCTETSPNLASGLSNAGFTSLTEIEKLKNKSCSINRPVRQQLLNQPTSRNAGVPESGTQKGSFETRRRIISHGGKFNRMMELPQQELQIMLMEKAKKDICMWLKDCRIPSAVLVTSKKGMEKKRRAKEKAPLNGSNAYGNRRPLDSKPRAHAEPLHPNSNVDANTEGADPEVITVPDSDFHDFDLDRTEKSFGDNQVWAAYDDDDGMPRCYAMIHNVISRKPLRMLISWLNSKSNRELAPLNWIGSGFRKTSGDFWIGKHEVNESLNSFSHRVKKWAKGTRGTIQIYPSKGDVWALYRNWSPDWSKHTEDEVIHKYDMVEVLEDYIEERGVVVAPLVKLAGFSTVFRRHPDCKKTMSIPKEELFRLSHQVPFCFLTGEEGRTAPKDCWELDPASMPMELFKVLSEVEAKEMVENAEKASRSLADVCELEEI